MTLPLEDDPRPPYVQAADVLRRAIQQGELSAGEKLPSARELQRRFGIASSTVQNALRLLKDEGLIYSVLGRGSYVRAPQEELEPSPSSNESDPPYVGLAGLRRGWQTAPADTRPPYIQTADALRKRIKDRDLRPGSKLPSARELQEEFGIANSTAQNALRVLRDEGLIYSVQGRGVFVRKLSDPDDIRKYLYEEDKKRAEQHQAEEDAIAHSGKSDAEIDAEAEQAKALVEKARAEYEAAMDNLRALNADQARRRRVRGEITPQEAAERAQTLRDRLEGHDKRR
ncbi:GntR family transcriptional regulator [Streptomyces sp. HUAS TT7]|uniref:winged helix-turn-helix domain-containing protein n=1 Tax=Streptomyces sp. HUAS TT7 TaxID=3447507 RepID=UPI003F656547